MSGSSVWLDQLLVSERRPEVRVALADELQRQSAQLGLELVVAGSAAPARDQADRAVRLVGRSSAASRCVVRSLKGTAGGQQGALWVLLRC
jgi:type II secretory pathway component PulJ